MLNNILDVETRKGLGLHLYDTLENKIPIVGLAKAKFGNTPQICELLRGESAKPLYITTKELDSVVRKLFKKSKDFYI